MEKSADFLQRKRITINTMNTNTDRQKIKLTPFIPPQLYTRFADLSKHCYDKRQENSELKTLIKLGEEDLILYTKHTGDKEWKNIDIYSIGDISPPEWHRLWPKQQLPEINSPPQGRRQSTKRDRLDDSSSSESDSPSHDNTKK